ncbi:M48 family metallopeptidase [Candidatus Nitrospira allomarina]|uniref:M48 family metallopeptidase n=1 Tax=Candidatus Nitrospira allomarina TaxID=3020900 RepID=A0AA96GHF5_9BACT|nr:M48 family metallopeptidase [Candidatus Nitrospira allomarina]WNM58549.1 M48 family metallopeptidase [Candidatus Nitrospira allomarina]
MAYPTEWKGSYYDGQSVVPQFVTITISGVGLTLRFADHTTTTWNYQEFRQTHGRYSGEEVRFERGTGIGETLVIPSPKILLAIHKHGGSHTSHFHHPRTRHTRVYGTVLAALASIPIVYGIFTWGIPSLAQPITAAIPLSWEIQLGQFVQQEVTAGKPVCDNPKLIHAVDFILTSLTKSIDPLPYQFQVTVVDSPLVNAMAAPGGYVIVFRGLLQDTASPEELAGVLAHEIQHVLLRHTMHLIVRHVSMAFVIAALSGDASGMVAYALQAAQTLQTLSYSREAEDQADEQGFLLLHRSGINPEGMVAFFAKLGKEQPANDVLRYLSTHPPTQDRLAHLKSLLPPASMTYRVFPFHAEWSNINTYCK